MATREFILPVRAPVGGDGSVLSDIVAQLQAASPNAPMFSTELADPSKRFLSLNHPNRPVDATKLMDPIGPWGTGPTGNPAWDRYATNSANLEGSTQLWQGAAGPYMSHYDTNTQEWWTANGATGRQLETMTLLRYSVARDEWRHWQGSSNGTGDGVWRQSMLTNGDVLQGGAHNFGGSAIDPINRRIFRLLRSGTSGTTDYLGWASMDNPSVAGVIPTPMFSGGAGYPTIEYFPEWHSIVHFARNNNLSSFRQWTRFDCATMQWVDPVADGMPSFNLKELPAHVYCNGAIYGVSNQANGAMWRLNADKSITSNLAATYSYTTNLGNVKYWDANHNENEAGQTLWQSVQLAALGNYIYAFWPGPQAYTDPPGNNGYIYRYDTTNDAGGWVLVDTMYQKSLPDPNGSAEVGLIDLGNQLDLYYAYTITAVPEYNCVLIGQSRKVISDDVALVWKP